LIFSDQHYIGSKFYKDD